MSLQWITVHNGLTMSHYSKGYEYRVRQLGLGDYLAIQENRDSRKITRRESVTTPAVAFDLCERWDQESR